MCLDSIPLFSLTSLMIQAAYLCSIIAERNEVSAYSRPGPLRSLLAAATTREPTRLLRSFAFVPQTSFFGAQQRRHNSSQQNHWDWARSSLHTEMWLRLQRGYATFLSRPVCSHNRLRMLPSVFGLASSVL